MTDATKEVARWRGTIADLNKKREAAEGRIEKLKGRKSPLTLKAHTGDEPAREKLGALNAKLLTECQESEDLQEAVHQAEAELAKAEDALAVEHEAERLRALARLATERIKAAVVVDQQIQALVQALTNYFGIGAQLQRHIGSRDVSFGAKVRSTGRAEGAVAHHLSGLLACIARMPRDSRDGPTLEDMEEAQLARLLIDPDKADEIASINSGQPLGESESEPERSAA